MAQKPTFVFVHGAGHLPETWDKVIHELGAKGYECVAVKLPSTLSDPAISFVDDVKAVQAAIADQTTQMHDVVVVVHSYGGHVGSSAINGFARSSDQPGSPPRGHVIGMAMMATGFTVTGLTFVELLGGKPPPEWNADTDTGYATLTGNEADLFYHDLPKDEADLWVSRITKQSLRALTEGGEYAYSGWKDVPCWFLVTMDDHALPPPVQLSFVKMAQDAGADVTLREIVSSHSPMLSKPKETADFILDAAAYFVGKQ